MHNSFSQLYQRCRQWSEKQGFPLIVTLCVITITATALWTNHHEPTQYASPTPPVAQEISAAQLLQESLRSVSTPLPSSTPEPVKWIAPLSEYQVLRPFQADLFHQSDSTGMWSIHSGADLAADNGTPVYAMSHGTILANGKDQLLGVWFLVAHDNTEVLYAGMIAGADFLAGDIVEAGDTLGYVGSGLLEEDALPPHLHLEARDNNILLDPVMLWQTDSLP